MLRDVLVPLDGSAEAMVALGPAATLAHYLGSEVTAVGCYHNEEHKAELAMTLPEQLSTLGGIPHRLMLEAEDESVGTTIGRISAQSPGRLLCMTTQGRGRSAAVLGSVAVDLLRQASGPLMLIGPNYKPGRFRCHGPLLVAIPPGDLTRSDSHARLILPTAQAFALTFDFNLELNVVYDPYAVAGLDPASSVSMAELGRNLHDDLHKLAEEVTAEIGSPVEHQVLQGAGVARTLVKRAEETGAAAVAMATDNPTGVTRLLLGSVTANVVHGAPCPVIVVRPGQ